MSVPIPLEWLSHCLFPSRCPECGQLMKKGEQLCSLCRRSILTVQQPRCLHCGSALEDCCCLTSPFHFRHLVCALVYEKTAKEKILELKFHKKRSNADFFARYVAQCVAENYSDVHFDFIVAAPMTAQDKKNRGYNQSELIARKAARFLSVPYCENAIIKTKQTEKQHELTYDKRIVNLIGAFQAQQTLVKGKTILLCDDVKATGSTLFHLSKALLQAGAEDVYCVSAVIS